ncbi:MAG: hypothetical protein LBP90_04680 [Burkholderiales bacterium]|nr:hypothetical protein [Burkholderiales bacterium]
MDTDGVFLAILRPEEERVMSLAVAKAALATEKWLATGGDSLSARAWKMLQAGSFGKIAGEKIRS